MDLLSILTSSENLYKYLLIGGIGLLILSLFYPIDKKYELACQRDVVNKEIKLLNYDIDNLQKSAEQLNSSSNAIESSLLALNKYNPNDIKRKQLLKDSFNRSLDMIIVSRADISKKVINIDYSKSKIATLDAHIKEFTKYETIFFWAGIIFSISGIIGWFTIMKKAP